MASLGGLLGNSPAIRALREQVDRLLRHVARHRPPPVLIQGETGTGKGLLAREMHRAGPRRDEPFVTVNCAAIPEPLLEAELFGFERGAFTDARHAKPGLFLTAHRGTLFLDEIGLLPLALQAKLLTVIEERAVRRLGSTRSEPADVWLVAATNADLAAATRGGLFREDLYHRLAVLTLALPPLRERGDDVILLAERFLTRACADYGLPAKTLGQDARAALLAHPWSGNVRELANVVERVALLEEARHVTAAMLGLERLHGARRSVADAAEPRPASLVDAVSDLERGRLLEVLRDTGWNASLAATRLGITRNQVRYRIEKYGLRPGAGTPRPGRRRPVPCPPLAPGTLPPRGGPSRAPRWERRHLAFLGVSLADPGGSESVSDATGALASHVEKIEGFGGAIEEASPTRLVAVLGLDPVEDAPVRAALAALAIRRAVERAGAVEPATPPVRLAIHVAQALIGGPGGVRRIDLDSRRAAVAVLEGLLDRARPGAILVSHAAAPFLDRRFELSRADARAPCWQLAGLDRSGFGLEGRPLSPFVGRAGEIQAVGALLEAVAGGRGQLLGIIGEPGVGKSRFVFELTRSDRVRGWRVLECRAVSHGTTTAYLPILELLRVYFGLEDSQPPARLRDRVVESVLGLGGGLEAHLPGLLGLLELPVEDSHWHALDPAHQRERRLEAVKRLLLRESQVQPLLLVVEDLHWSDSETLAVLDTLAESLAAARILLVVTYRPDLRHPWGGRSYYTQLRLDPLTPAGTAELLRGLLGENESLRPVVELVTERTEGNAFFLEETVRTLLDTGVLSGVPGAYRLARVVESIEVPGTVHALLAARIDRLPSQDKGLLQSAAVIGRDVPLGLLASLAGAGDDEALRAGLQRLQAAEFLYEAPLAGGESGYTFKHALSHEVAYGTLTDEVRRTLHARVVEALEALDVDRPGGQPERLAHHALRGELWERALTFSQQAGRRAAARCAFREATAAFEQALVALDHLPPSREAAELAIDLRFELRNVLQPLMTEDERMLRHLEVAERIAGELGDGHRLGRVLVYRSTISWLYGDLERAVSAAAAALEMAEALGDVDLEVTARVHLGAPWHALGEHRRAAAYLEPAVELSGGQRLHERLGLAHVASVLSRGWRVRCLAELGAFDEGLRQGQEAVRIADAAGHLVSQVAAYLAVGYLHLRRGNLPEAITALETALDLEERTRGSGWLPTVRAALGYAHCLAGRLAQALPLLEQRGGRQEGRALRAGWLAAARLRAGRAADAARLCEEALALARAHHERGNEAWAQHLAGEIGLARDPLDAEGVEEAYRRALDLAGRLEMRPLAAHCQLGLAWRCQRSGEPAAAREHLQAAATAYREMGMRFWLERAEAELGPPRGSPR